MKAADHAFAKLKSVLGNRTLPLNQRLRVYVASTLMYRVLAVGMGPWEVIRHLARDCKDHGPWKHSSMPGRGSARHGCASGSYTSRT